MNWHDWRDRLVRPGATAVAIAAHALVLMGVALPHPPSVGADDNIEIAITQAGDAAAEEQMAPADEDISQQAAQAAQKPEEGKEEPVKDPPPEPEPPKPNEKPEQVVAEPPRREVEDSIAVQKRLEEIKEQKKRERQKRLAADAAEAQEEHHARSGANAGGASAHSRAAYAHRVLAEIRRHQQHPPISGVVRVAFDIGAGGGVSASVAGSSGHGMLDSMAVRILRSCHPGAPPGGHFSGTVAIRFN